MDNGRLNKALATATTHGVLEAALIKNPEKYISDEKVHPGNSTKVLKIVIGSAVGKVPVVGALFSGLLKTIWPDGSNNMWNDMKDKVERLVKERIDENNAEHHRDRLQGLYLVLDNYTKQPRSVQHIRFPALLSIILHDVPVFLNDRSPWLSLPYFVYFGTLYLSALWTQWKFCHLIDGCNDSKSIYETDLRDAIEKLQDAVDKAKQDCLDRRKKLIKSHSTTHWRHHMNSEYKRVQLEDEYGHTKFTIDEETAEAKQAVANVTKQLRHYIDLKYGSELDDILEPTRLWSLYLNDNDSVALTHHYLEFPGWAWNGIFDNSQWFDTRSCYEEHGRLSAIEYYHAVTKYGNYVRGIELFYGDDRVSSGLVGTKRGTHCVIEIDWDQMITHASAMAGASLNALSFTRTSPVKDAYGKIYSPGNQYVTYTNSSTGEYLKYEGESRINEVWEQFRKQAASVPDHSAHVYNGTLSHPNPTKMLWATGWHRTWGGDSYIGLFQPVFGCKEIILDDGTSRWK